ncbi:MAG: DUF1003 domain-containing protein [Bacteroidetes bacterium]|nr:DUF1003 domain-containing protein [Bacteroidota bacterium]
MKKTRREKIDALIESEVANLDKVTDFLNEEVNDDELLTHILKESDDNGNLSFGERMADKVAEFGGSWAFILSFMGFLVLWIVLNSYLVMAKPIDPYPFIFLNLMLSCLAALQAPVIMMSQNRKEENDRRRAQHDYLINMKAEIEIRNLQQNMKKLFEIQQKQMEVLNKLQDQLCKKD